MPVTLVGAGPGEKGLLTLKGAQRIREADVVLYDRFVCEEILAMIPPAAERINVGKNAGNHPVPQAEINRLLLEKARQGRKVVRLKGGDPFVFGRGGEELELLVEHGIPFEVVPGVTAAVAGAAYAGIPVTHRDYASSFHVITGQGKNNETPDINYRALVSLGGTLVFMMGVAVIGEICAGCIAAGMDGDMPAAIVENAASGAQRKFVGTVGTLPSIAREMAVQSPAVTIIGKVCRLSGRFDWHGRKPLLGKRILVARASPGMSKLSDMLSELGCRVAELAPADIVALTSPGCGLEKAVEDIDRYKWLVFTSAVGVNVFFDYLMEAGIDVRRLHHLRVACVGEATEREVNKRGVLVAYRPDEYNGAALGRGLVQLIRQEGQDEGAGLFARDRQARRTREAEQAGTAGTEQAGLFAQAGQMGQTREAEQAGLFVQDGQMGRTKEDGQAGTAGTGGKVLIARAKDGAAELTEILEDAGVAFDDVAIYEKTHRVEMIGLENVDCVAFASSSAVRWFAEAVGRAGAEENKRLSGMKAVCIGERTGASALALGMDVFLSDKATMESMVKKIKELCT